MHGSEEITDEPAGEDVPVEGEERPPAEGEPPQEEPIPLHLYTDWRPAPRRQGRALPAAHVLGLVRELSDGWQGEPVILAVTSGKGGVGKSNIAAALAVLLAAAGARVALIDGDLGLGNLDVLLGVRPRVALAEVLGGRRGLREALTPLAGGVDFAGGGGAAAGRLLDPLRRLRLLEELGGLRKDYDLVILDCGSGLGGEVLDFCGLADRVMVVTTAEPTALAAAYGVLKALSAKGQIGKASVVVNAVEDLQEAEAAYARIASVTERFLGAKVADGGYVLSDPAVARAVRKQKVFIQAYPRCEAARCVAAVAARIMPAQTSGEGPGRGGLLGRILGYLD